MSCLSLMIFHRTSFQNSPHWKNNTSHYHCNRWRKLQHIGNNNILLHSEIKFECQSLITFYQEGFVGWWNIFLNFRHFSQTFPIFPLRPISVLDWIIDKGAQVANFQWGRKKQPHCLLTQNRSIGDLSFLCGKGVWKVQYWIKFICDSGDDNCFQILPWTSKPGSLTPNYWIGISLELSKSKNIIPEYSLAL